MADKICLDATNRKRMLRASDVLADHGFSEASRAVRALHGNSDLALHSTALGELRRVPDVVVHEAGLTTGACQGSCRVVEV